MRVIECDSCGETISAATDDELVDALDRHHQDEHEIEEPDREKLAELVEEGAYDATDS